MMWEGDWTALESYVRGLFPTGHMPGFTLPWPVAVDILLGPRPESAVSVGAVSVDDREPADFAQACISQINEVLNDLPNDRTSATVTIRPRYDAEASPGNHEPPAPITRNFTRSALLPNSNGPKNIIESVKDVFKDPTVGAGIGVKLPFPRNEEADDDGSGLFEPVQRSGGSLASVSGGNIDSVIVFRTFALLESEIQAQRARNGELTSKLVDVLGGILQSSAEDAKRYSQEAAQNRQAFSTVERKLIEAEKELEMLRVEREMFGEQTREVRRLKRYIAKEMKRRPKSTPKKTVSGDFLSEVTERVMAMMQQDKDKPVEDPKKPAEPPPPEARRPPGAPKGAKRRRDRYQEPAKPGTSPGGIMEMLGGLTGGSMEPSKIASVIAMLPAGMRNEIVSALVDQYPQAALGLGEALEERFEEKIDAAKKAQGEEEEEETEIDEDDEDDDEDEDEDDEEVNDEDEDDLDDLDFGEEGEE